MVKFDAILILVFNDGLFLIRLDLAQGHGKSSRLLAKVLA